MRLSRYHLPELRITGSTFFDPDMTYLNVIQDFSLLLATICYNWNIGDCMNSLTPQEQGLSDGTLLLYALTFSFRLAEYYPFQHLNYDVAVCMGFAIIFWITLFKWMYYSSKEPTPAVAARLLQGQRLDTLEPPKPIGRFRFLHVAVIFTAFMAYTFNYEHLKITPKLFCFAWAHYLEAVAMIPQYWDLAMMAKKGELHVVPKTLFAAIWYMALSRIFQLVNWMYLWHIADMWDKLGVYSAAAHLAMIPAFALFIGFCACYAPKKPVEEVPVHVVNLEDEKGKGEINNNI